MTNLPPPNEPRSSQRDPLGFDEFVGIFVALTTIGAILLWSLARRHEGFNLSFLPLSPSPSAQPANPSSFLKMVIGMASSVIFARYVVSSSQSHMLLGVTPRRSDSNV